MLLVQFCPFTLTGKKTARPLRVKGQRSKTEDLYKHYALQTYQKPLKLFQSLLFCCSFAYMMKDCFSVRKTTTTNTDTTVNERTNDHRDANRCSDSSRDALHPASVFWSVLNILCTEYLIINDFKTQTQEKCWHRLTLVAALLHKSFHQNTE